uniref:F-box associated beta-propeller type 1 domain-containing protein n=1 Tax=Chenopodium quinoa TaxID=63459 RepID=A0A803L7S3_CHEQI
MIRESILCDHPQKEQGNLRIISSWFMLIVMDVNFGDENLIKLGFDFRGDDLVLIGTCNGLVCLASFSGFFFILWNPITGRFKKYLDPDLLLDSPCRVSWGFGYVSSIDDYKIVRILELNDYREIWVHVFSLKSKKWTRISDELYKDIFSLKTNEHEEIGFDHSEEPIRNPYAFHSRQGILVNETLYWIVSEVDDFGRKIIAFDLALEMFDSPGDLDLVSNTAYRDKFLCVMGRWTGKFYVLLEDSTIGVINPSSKPMKYTPILTWKRNRLPCRAEATIDS